MELTEEHLKEIDRLMYEVRLYGAIGRCSLLLGMIVLLFTGTLLILGI